jgi:hypothetical protein
LEGGEMGVSFGRRKDCGDGHDVLRKKKGGALMMERKYKAKA